MKGTFISRNYIPDFELECTDPNKSSKPWRGKNSQSNSKVSVEMPADDWLLQKLERLNLSVAEEKKLMGYTLISSSTHPNPRISGTLCTG